MSANTSYAALWRRPGAPVFAGKAVLEERFLLLSGSDRRGREASERLALDELVEVRVARDPHERIEGRPVLVLGTSEKVPLRLACLDSGSLLELTERLTRQQQARALAASPRPRADRVRAHSGRARRGSSGQASA